MSWQLPVDSHNSFIIKNTVLEYGEVKNFKTLGNSKSY